MNLLSWAEFGQSKDESVNLIGYWLYAWRMKINNRLPYLQTFWLVQIGHVIPLFSVFFHEFQRRKWFQNLILNFQNYLDVKWRFLDICFPKLTWVFETQVWAIWPWRFDRKISHLNLLSKAGFLSLLLLVRIFINFTFCNIAKFLCLWRKIFSRNWDKSNEDF